MIKRDTYLIKTFEGKQYRFLKIFDTKNRAKKEMELIKNLPLIRVKSMRVIKGRYGGYILYVHPVEEAISMLKSPNLFDNPRLKERPEEW